MQNLQERRKGSQLRGLECPVWAQIPRPCSAPLAFQAGRKNTDEVTALPAWEGGMRQQQGKGSPARRWRGDHLRGVRKMDVPASVHSPAALGQPQHTAQLTGMISHRASAPARVSVFGIILHQEGKRKPTVACMEEDRRGHLNLQSSQTDDCSHPCGLPHPSGPGEAGQAGQVTRAPGFHGRGCRLPPPHLRAQCAWCSHDPLPGPRSGQRGGRSVPSHSEHIQPYSVLG